MATVGPTVVHPEPLDVGEPVVLRAVVGAAVWMEPTHTAALSLEI